MPGGVNSPVRAFRAVGGHPPFIARASGARLWDADERRIHRLRRLLGPGDPRACPARRDRGGEASRRRRTVLRGADGARGAFAEAIIERHPSIEMMRCVSSGTEATMSALRVARGFTGRDVIVKFDGCYHGHSDALLVKAGSGAATFGNPDSAGVPKGIGGEHGNPGLQRSRGSRGAVRQARTRDRCRDPGTRRGQHGLCSTDSRIPRERAGAVHRQRRPVDLRRGDDWLSPGTGQRPRTIQHPPGSHLLGQGRWRRNAAGRLRWATGRDGADRTARARVSSRDAQRESGRGGGRSSDPGALDRRGLRAPRAPGRAARRQGSGRL